jgi:hypothetical protein
MQRHLRMTVVLFIALCATGCAVDPIRRFGDQRPMTQENTGYALLSIGPAKAPGYATHYNILLREKPDGKPVSVLYTKDAVFVTPTTPDFSNDAGEGAVYLIALPAGKYEVHRYRAFRTNQFNLFSPDVLSPFSVAAGQVTYVGRFMIEAVWLGRNPNGPPVLIRGTQTVALDEDLAIARRKFAAELGSIGGGNVN